MNFRPAIFSLLLTFPGAGAWAQDIDAFARGEEALAGKLWEVAAMRFSELLESPDLDPVQRAKTEIHLVEAMIRGGRPAESLVLLEESRVAALPEAYFWKGQALAGLGRLAEAIEAFEIAYADPAPPHRKQAIFTRANLQLALGQTEAALESLARLAELAGPATTAETRLRQIEILLELGRADEARKLMPAVTTIPDSARPHAQFIEATLLLAEGQAEAASSVFSALLSEPRGQSLLRHHAAALGLANALHTSGNPRAASDSLLDFIGKNQDSPLLEAYFERLLAWLPASPSASDPLIERLASWVPPPPAPAAGLIAGGASTAAAAWPRQAPTSDLAAFSLFTRGIALRRLNSPDSRHLAKTQLTRLTLEYPSHFLSRHALLELSRWLLSEGDRETAGALLDVVRDEKSVSPNVRGVAAHIAGRAAYIGGEARLAADLFEEAASMLPPEAIARARFNAALALLASGDVVTVQADPDAPFPVDLETSLKLEQALVATPPAQAAAALEGFLTDHPDHPRAPEARIAAAEAALAVQPPDAATALAHLNAFTDSPAAEAVVAPARLALARLRLDDLAGDPAVTIAAARAFLERFPTEPAAAEAAFILGRNHIETGSYNDARVELEKLAATAIDPARIQAALLLAAHSAALVPTVRSKEEALELFERAIAADGPLTPFARLKKARLMIDLGRFLDATGFLRPWLASLPEEHALQLPGGMLLAEALAAGHATSREEALAIRENLLDHSDLTPTLRHQLQYLRGRLLEELPKPENPAQTREAEALEAYYSVLESASHPPAEWIYFELSGTRALALLENAKRWKAAITVAEKIASFGGKAGDDAAKRAQDIRLKHMIWED